MSDRSKIEWTATIHADGSVTPGATWNPLRAYESAAGGRVGWHCVKISPACAHCYAATMNRRLGTGLPYSAGSPADVFIDEKVLTKPLRWKRPRKIFVCSMTDLFGEWVNDATIDVVFAVMALADRHTFQVLTKRPERMATYLGDRQQRLANWSYVLGQIGVNLDLLKETALTVGGFESGALWPLPNVWVGVTAEDQTRYDERVGWLMKSPAEVRFLSCEPLLGPLRLKGFGTELWKHGIQPAESYRPWVIVGGESGQQARPMHPDWVRLIRQDCELAGVPFFFKQWGEWLPISQMKFGQADALAVTTEPTVLHPEGKTAYKVATHHFRYDPATGHQGHSMFRVGKKAAGRLLDGREWNEFPQTEAARC